VPAATTLARLNTVEPRYLHKFLDSRIQVGDFKVASFVLGCRPCTQQCAQTCAIDVRDVAQINYDPAGSRSDFTARFRDEIANLPLKHLRIFGGNLALTVDDGLVRSRFQLQV
jgi:hypothetical protein